MDKLQKCRICLAENVRMYVVVNSNMRELYERLTDIPVSWYIILISAERRPLLDIALPGILINQDTVSLFHDMLTGLLV